MMQATRKHGQRYTCQFVPTRLGGTMRASTFVSQGPHQALGAFVQLDVPQREPGWITVCDDQGEVVLSAHWPPDASPRA